MKPSFLPLFILLFYTSYLGAQGFQPINAFHAEKDYPGEKIRQTENGNAMVFIRQILGDFELGSAQMIAILINGKYEARIHGDGNFDLDKTSERLNDKIILGSIDRIEARYDLNYNDPWNSVPYKGTINFVIPALTNPNLDPNTAPEPEPDPEPWDNPMTRRLLAAQEPDVRAKRMKANSAPRAGLFAGTQLRAQSIYIGFPVEVPITRQLSLGASIMWNRKSQDFVEIDSTGYESLSRNVELSVEASVMARYYLNNTYPRYYVVLGPYLERARLKQDYDYLPEAPKFGKAHTAIGFNFGLGILFYSRLNVNVGWSAILSNPSKLLPYQDRRGTSISVGWLFGKR